jgi:hypothetical protein
MKKLLTIIIAVAFLLTSGCTKTNSIPNASNQGSDVNNLKQSTQADLTTGQTNASSITNTTASNLFFFKNKDLKLNYKGTFLFGTIVEKDIKLNINELVNLKYGKLYELKLDPIKGVPDERLSLGYFYVQNDKIYKIEPTKENISKLKTSEELPNDNVVVCLDKEIKDTLGKNEAGFHHYLEVKGDKREYHSYNNQVSTGYYESFTWEKGKGLTNYQSGYGAERDSIELQLINDEL